MKKYVLAILCCLLSFTINAYNNDNQFENKNIFAPWNNILQNDVFSPWSSPLYKNDPLAPWNNVIGNQQETNSYLRETGEKDSNYYWK